MFLSFFVALFSTEAAVNRFVSCKSNYSTEHCQKDADELACVDRLLEEQPADEGVPCREGVRDGEGNACDPVCNPVAEEEKSNIVANTT